MKRKSIFISCMCGMLFGLYGCFHESELSVSRLDQDWYVLEDSNDELDHLRYQVFEQYGVPIFYKDTIGSRVEGTDLNGNPVIYYEILDPNYDLVSLVDEIELHFSKNREELIVAVNFMKNEVLPLFCSRELMPRCFLLVDSVYVACYSGGTGINRHEDEVYRSMMASVMGKVNRLDEISGEERERFIRRIVAEEWGAHLVKFKAEELLPFFTISESEVYSKSTTYSKNSTTGSNPGAGIPYKDYREYGFLDYNHWYAYEESKSYWTVNKTSDVVDYVTEVLLENDEAFEAKYKSYKWVLQKYELMKTIVESVTAELKAESGR